MIFLNSRYADSALLGAADSRKGTKDVAVYRRFPSFGSRQAYTTYTWVEGDRIDIVAARFFADPTQYWRILDANPQVLDPSTLVPGESIRVPRA
jgi:nucleoid-associated protein YgaU